MGETRKYFGTDGIRGVVNQFPMTAELAQNLGRAVAYFFKNKKNLKRRPKIIVGKDTRSSGYMLEYALAGGLLCQGADVYFVGPLPTPGIAFITSSLRADAGLVISASHNFYQDNGIKIFDAKGYKLDDELEKELEILLESDILNKNLPEPENIGKAVRIDDAVGRYVVFLKNTFPKHKTLEGLSIVLDCAHGAAYKVAPLVFKELGAKVHVIGNQPDGVNINLGVGSLHPEVCAKKVLELKADIGLALDGDADRIIVIDERGKVLNGDQLMTICAKKMKKDNLLAKNTVVATVMSNMGLEKALAESNIKLIRTQVGDRYVAEYMRKHGCNFGGEQSGHLIFFDHGTAGDGILASLQVLSVMVEKERPLSELAATMVTYPQILINVSIANPKRVLVNSEIKKAVKKIEKDLAGKGRVLLRPSGTEPLVRIMLEGEDKAEIKVIAQQLAQLVKKILG